MYGTGLLGTAAKCLTIATMDDPAKHARVFFALWPDTAERGALAAWQPPLHRLCGGRSMRADTLHVTLVFVGNMALQRMEALKLAAQEVTGTAFRLELEVASYWGHNHIVYAAPIAIPQPLSALVRELEKNLARHRFHFDQRPYQPHATLLRNAQWRDAPLPPLQPVAWQAKEFVLLQSVQGERGIRYEVLARFKLS